jgi:hypothetical protein
LNLNFNIFDESLRAVVFILVNFIILVLWYCIYIFGLFLKENLYIFIRITYIFLNFLEFLLFSRFLILFFFLRYVFFFLIERQYFHNLVCIIMHKLVEQNLLLFKTQKVENILAQNFVLFLCFFFRGNKLFAFASRI